MQSRFRADLAHTLPSSSDPPRPSSPKPSTPVRAKCCSKLRKRKQSARRTPQKHRKKEKKKKKQLGEGKLTNPPAPPLTSHTPRHAQHARFARTVRAMLIQRHMGSLARHIHNPPTLGLPTLPLPRLKKQPRKSLRRQRRPVQIDQVLLQRLLGRSLLEREEFNIPSRVDEDAGNGLSGDGGFANGLERGVDGFVVGDVAFVGLHVVARRVCAAAAGFDGRVVVGFERGRDVGRFEGRVEERYSCALGAEERAGR